MCNTEEIGLNEYKLIFSEGICDISKLNRESRIKRLFSSMYNKIFARNSIKPSVRGSFYSKINLVVYYMRKNYNSIDVKNDLSEVKSSKEYIKGKFDSNVQDGSLVSIIVFMLAVLSIVVDMFQNIFVTDKIEDNGNYIININFNITILNYLLLLILIIVFIVLLTKQDIKYYNEQISYYTYLESELENLICDNERDCHNNERLDNTTSTNKII